MNEKALAEELAKIPRRVAALEQFAETGWLKVEIMNLSRRVSAIEGAAKPGVSTATIMAKPGPTGAELRGMLERASGGEIGPTYVIQPGHIQEWGWMMNTLIGLLSCAPPGVMSLETDDRCRKAYADMADVLGFNRR